MEENGGLKKLEIKKYENSNYNEPSIGGGVFEVFINPNSYSLTYKNEFNSEGSEGQQAGNLKFVETRSPELNLEFLFDGTGVVQKNSGNRLLNILSGNDDFAAVAVEKQLSDFLEATGDYNGTIHKPFNIKINWGNLEFLGVLLEFTVDYKMFTPQGKPLRAIGKAKFHGSISEKLANAKNKPSSPDLTHVRMVKAGDTLPLMTERIYGDDKYYLEVARINNITSFRQLKPGTEIFFPPIAKVS